jgi:protocatechuate 3,4-dioxygenase beta subunit
MRHDYRPTRRTAIRDLGIAGFSLAGARVLGSELTTTDDAEAASCVLTPELTEGPYYLDLEKIRRNITEGHAGLRLDLKIKVVDSTECTPIENVAVDIWHCDASGTYSGVQGNSGTFLRGVQLTNASGVATFRTIYPGWYQGRATHIHLKAHVGGRKSGSKYTGGHVAHTGQLFFADSTTDKVAKLSPYNSRNITRTRNSQDNIYGQGGTKVSLKRRKAGTIRRGFVANITVGIDPSATTP